MAYRAVSVSQGSYFVGRLCILGLTKLVVVYEAQWLNFTTLTSAEGQGKPLPEILPLSAIIKEAALDMREWLRLQSIDDETSSYTTRINSFGFYLLLSLFNILFDNNN